ncbi:hypothetical protein COCCADRAFT_81622 [Bipolaris zeicola 26-R-13]|uniref:C2H2-type domain-containing protein n=1 Tax=Cochliobolus carbonum (strain 26-R-13) TaxID=930089 RepID=W6YI44_COCC2|nr:uncharacterized protein COCCADRAFT_81622 [Bipolaris zeicola 26-R-13]EUC38982.1 hypothetical protein COCCADRAFT_81622 [Bipolaris zeicola 26-R-13]
MAMHLASMVHGSPRGYAMSGVAASSYPVQPPAHTQQVEQQYRQQVQHQQQQQQQQQHQQQQPQKQQRPQSPPSPPAEEKKPSLPSISSLLEFAGNEKTASSDSASQSPQSQQRKSASPQLRQEQQPQPQYTPVSAPNNSRMTLPPTPPMHPDVAHDGNQSPSAASNHSAASTPYFVGGALNNMEPHQQRQNFSTVPPMKRDSMQSHSMSPYSASMYGQSPYQSSPGAASSASFYSPEQHSYNTTPLYSQRPLPSNFQPHAMPLPVPVPSPAANGSNPWQHHHYISTSSQSQFPQPQDRYICSTCNKAFSRPSSLRIHSHSHTGEKPYKCPQPGCGKAFSVRSNMKRHERGCHAASSTTLTA